MKQRLRKIFGPQLQSVAFYSRLMQLSCILQGKAGAIVLMYHSVADDSLSPWIDPANHVPAQVFAEQMEFLSRHRKVVPLSFLVDAIRQGKRLENGTVAITFDDGYLDNLTVAAPILDHYGFSATLFLATGYLDREEPQWIDQAFTAFTFRSSNKLAWGEAAATQFDLDDQAQRRAGYRAVCETLLAATHHRRRLHLAELAEQLRPTGQPPRLTLNWDDIRALKAKHRCFEIGAHTMEHTDLCAASPDEALTEFRGCARRIEEETGVKPRHFSFCYGRTSESLRRQAAEAGFTAACGGEGLDPLIRAPADLFRLPRVAAPAKMGKFALASSSFNTGIWRKLGR